MRRWLVGAMLVAGALACGADKATAPQPVIYANSRWVGTLHDTTYTVVAYGPDIATGTSSLGVSFAVPGGRAIDIRSDPAMSTW
jgi:hypothetical protein